MKICWYMRGGVTWGEVMTFGPADREIANALIKENLETTKKTGQPFFQNIVYYNGIEKCR